MSGKRMGRSWAVTGFVLIGWANQQKRGTIPNMIADASDLAGVEVLPIQLCRSHFQDFRLLVSFQLP
jgi:hypothetical protein